MSLSTMKIFPVFLLKSISCMNDLFLILKYTCTRTIDNSRLLICKTSKHNINKKWYGDMKLYGKHVPSSCGLKW